MPLPHYTQLIGTGAPGGPGTKPYEPVYLNLFEIFFALPIILQNEGRDPFLLLQNALSIPINLTDDFGRGTPTQRFKYSTRVFLTTPNQTHVEFSIKFQVNVNDGFSMEVWNTLKRWYDLAWNARDGRMHYKSDLIGSLIVNQHDKKGVVLRRVTYVNTQLKNIGGISLDWASNSNIWEFDANFVSDYFIDEYIDPSSTLNTNEYIQGYP